MGLSLIFIGLSRRPRAIAGPWFRWGLLARLAGGAGRLEVDRAVLLEALALLGGEVLSDFAGGLVHRALPAGPGLSLGDESNIRAAVLHVNDGRQESSAKCPLLSPLWLSGSWVF